MKAFKTLVVMIALTSFLGNLVFAQGVDRIEMLRQQNFYIDTIQQCSQVNSLGKLVSQNWTQIARSWQGIKDTFGGNPFLPSNKTDELLKSEGYWHALNDCFGESTFKQIAFSMSVIAADRAGYYGSWALATYLIYAFTVSKYVLAFRVAHPTAYLTVMGLMLGGSIASLITTIIEDSSEMYKERQLKKNSNKYIDEAAFDIDKSSQTDLDESYQIVQDALKDINTELNKRKLDPNRKIELLSKKKQLEDILRDRQTKPKDQLKQP